jgi:phytoene dehydrogenase-like protein
MDETGTLIVGAGITGLATAAALGDREYIVLEASHEIGGYCKTIQREGFTWDYSGHFFHFKHPEIEAWLRARMGGQKVRWSRSDRSSLDGARVDFSFFRRTSTSCRSGVHRVPVRFVHGPRATRAAGPGAVRAPRRLPEMLYARFAASPRSS